MMTRRDRTRHMPKPEMHEAAEKLETAAVVAEVRLAMKQLEAALDRFDTVRNVEEKDAERG